METRKISFLSPARQLLLRQLQDLQFGRIENLAVIRGEPVWDAGCRLIRTVKFGSANPPQTFSADFELKKQVRELFQTLDETSEGLILSLEVKHGLPFAVDIIQSPIRTGKEELGTR